MEDRDCAYAAHCKSNMKTAITEVDRMMSFSGRNHSWRLVFDIITCSVQATKLEEPVTDEAGYPMMIFFITGKPKDRIVRK